LNVSDESAYSAGDADVTSMQVKLAHEHPSEPALVSSSDTHDSHDMADDDDTKPSRRSFTEAPVPPVS